MKQDFGCDDGSPETEWDFVFAGFKKPESGIADFCIWISQETYEAITSPPCRQEMENVKGLAADLTIGVARKLFHIRGKAGISYFPDDRQDVPNDIRSRVGQLFCQHVQAISR